MPPPSSKVPANFPASKPRLRRDTKFVIRPDAASTGDISRASKGFAVDHGKLTPFIEKYVPSSQPPITAPVKEAMPEALPSRSRSDQSGVEKRNIYRASKSSLQISFTKSRHELADYYTGRYIRESKLINHRCLRSEARYPLWPSYVVYTDIVFGAEMTNGHSSLERKRCADLFVSERFSLEALNKNVLKAV